MIRLPTSLMTACRMLAVASAILLVMLMAVGPGVLLINRPDFIFGIPFVYAWAILWYLVLCVIALFCYPRVWSNAGDTDDEDCRS